jgi:hypothetical protein
MMAYVGSGTGGLQNRLTQAQLGILIVAAFVVLAVGLARMSSGSGKELAAPPIQRTASDGDYGPTTIPPSQPAVVVSFSKTGEIIRSAPVIARIIDPETGEEVLVPLPPGSTVVNGEVVPIGSTGSSVGVAAATRPGTGTTGTTDGSSTTKIPTTTQPPATQPPTTETPTTETPTTETPTTETPTTETPTTETPTTETPPTETPTTEAPTTETPTTGV